MYHTVYSKWKRVWPYNSQNMWTAGCHTHWVFFSKSHFYKAIHLTPFHLYYLKALALWWKYITSLMNCLGSRRTSTSVRKANCCKCWCCIFCQLIDWVVLQLKNQNTCSLKWLYVLLLSANSGKHYWQLYRCCNEALRTSIKGWATE